MAKATVVIEKDRNTKQHEILCVVKFRGRNVNEVNSKVAALKGQMTGTAWALRTRVYE